MFETLCKRGWRGAIGLIAAYALVLQAMLAYGTAAQAAARGDISGSFFVICVNDDAGALPDGTTAPAKAATHCPICTMSVPAAAPAPEMASLPLPPSTLVRRTLFVSAEACIAFHNARSGLTRAPPQNA